VSRRERIKKAKTRMPVILRNLTPDSTFDPREMWEKEKAAMLVCVCEYIYISLLSLSLNDFLPCSFLSFFFLN
jgi:hypothetical protein